MLKTNGYLLARALVFLVCATLNLACNADTGQASPKDAFHWNRLLGKGVNLGNALEAPMEGLWGVTLEASDFKRVAAIGFDSVRIPVRWSAHMQSTPPYTIEPEFMARVTWAVDQALAQGLVVVINVHHFAELMAMPMAYRQQLLSIWQQVATHYQNYPPELYFEILNEPTNQMDVDKWNALLNEALEVIRTNNPKRAVVIGPANWNNFRELPTLQLPKQDRNIIATVHYYDPFPFTHQGAEWVQDAKVTEWVGTEWPQNKKEEKQLKKDFEQIKAWSVAEDRPIYVGEFGAYQVADMKSRARWTRAVVNAASRQGFSISYWEYSSGFGLYDSKKMSWRTPLLDAMQLDK